jgi:hypothetical protein
MAPKSISPKDKITQSSANRSQIGTNVPARETPTSTEGELEDESGKELELEVEPSHSSVDSDSTSDIHAATAQIKAELLAGADELVSSSLSSLVDEEEETEIAVVLVAEGSEDSASTGSKRKNAEEDEARARKRSRTREESEDEPEDTVEDEAEAIVKDVPKESEIANIQNGKKTPFKLLKPWPKPTARMLKVQADKREETKRRTAETKRKNAATAEVKKRREEEERRKEGGEEDHGDVEMEDDPRLQAFRQASEAFANSITTYVNSVVDDGVQRLQDAKTSESRAKQPPKGTKAPGTVNTPVEVADEVVDEPVIETKSARRPSSRAGPQVMCRLKTSKDLDEPGCGRKSSVENPLAACSFNGCTKRMFCTDCKEGRDKSGAKIKAKGINSKGVWFCSKECRKGGFDEKKAREKAEEEEKVEDGTSEDEAGDGEAGRDNATEDEEDDEDEEEEEPKPVPTPKPIGKQCQNTKCKNKFDSGKKKRAECEFEGCPGGKDFCEVCINKKKGWSGKWLVDPDHWFCSKECLKGWQDEMVDEASDEEEFVKEGGAKAKGIKGKGAEKSGKARPGSKGTKG